MSSIIVGDIEGQFGVLCWVNGHDEVYWLGWWFVHPDGVRFSAITLSPSLFGRLFRERVFSMGITFRDLVEI